MPVRNYEPEKQEISGDNTPPVEGEPQQVRELSQTDRLNKKLLQSFLERINQPNSQFTQSSAAIANAQEEQEDDFA